MPRLHELSLRFQSFCLQVRQIAASGSKNDALWKAHYSISKMSRPVDVILQLPSGKLSHNYRKSPFLMGKCTINCHFQQLCQPLPEGIRCYRCISVPFFAIVQHPHWPQQFDAGCRVYDTVEPIYGQSCAETPREGDWAPTYNIHKKKHINYENLHRSCVLTGGLCFMDWTPPNWLAQTNPSKIQKSNYCHCHKRLGKI